MLTIQNESSLQRGKHKSPTAEWFLWLCCHKQNNETLTSLALSDTLISCRHLYISLSNYTKEYVQKHVYCTCCIQFRSTKFRWDKITMILKNAYKNQLLVVHQNKAINISISKCKARLDKYTCFISHHAERPAQQENFKTSWSFNLKLKLTKDSEQNQCKNKSFSGAVCFFLTGFRWEILNLISILKYHCIFLDLSVLQPKVSYFATDTENSTIDQLSQTVIHKKGELAI